ncbi:MAG: nucleoside recognition protein [Lachnospiraceae bacterium]|nr:nucleoside recognition protein [Lachnospiraceae bacterium]
MLNYIWGGMLLIGIVYAFFTGNMEAVSAAALEYAEAAVSLCITMAGIMGVWVGLMEIAQRAGLVKVLTRKMDRVITFLFPDIPQGHVSRNHISMNLVANILGLGWACTPAGLLAMESLSKLNEKKDTATSAMCGFLILNISSLQLIPINMIAYRSQYGSNNPTAIILPAILATMCSTFAAVLYIRAAYRREKRC